MLYKGAPLTSFFIDLLSVMSIFHLLFCCQQVLTQEWFLLEYYISIVFFFLFQIYSIESKKVNFLVWLRDEEQPISTEVLAIDKRSAGIHKLSKKGGEIFLIVNNIIKTGDVLRTVSARVETFAAACRGQDISLLLTDFGLPDFVRYNLCFISRLVF